jgi:hypothetical protein
MLAEAVLAMAAQLPTQDFRDDDVRAASVEIAHVVTETPRPLFKTREFDAAVLLTTAFAEARFVHDAIGDGGGALCMFQLHEAPRSVLTDVAECTREGYARIRLSIRICPSAPLAQYIGGCNRTSARWQSSLRLSIARHILAEAQKRREFRSPAHLVRDIVEDALLPATVRSRGRLGARRGRKADQVRLCRPRAAVDVNVNAAGQRQARASSDVELMTAPKSPKSPKLSKALELEWPYEPGWYTTQDDGYTCIGDSCTRRGAPELPTGSMIYIGASIGEVYCQTCQFERRKRAS